MLLLTSVAAVDCATPINGVYPETLAFAVGAFVLFDSKTSPTRFPWTRLAAMASAMAAAFANAAALAVWPLLTWYAWRTRAGRWWTTVVALIGVAFTLVYVRGLPLAAIGDSGIDGVEPGAQIVRAVTYLCTYLGLPWTRAASLELAGRLVGAGLLLASVAAVVRFGFVRRPDRLERLAVALIAFSLATAGLAAAGRADVESPVLVPVRYSVFVAPMHVGLLLLVWPTVFASARREQRAGMVAAVASSLRTDAVVERAALRGGENPSTRDIEHPARLVRAPAPLEYAVAVILAILLLVQQVASGERAAAATRSMRAVLDRFASGEQSDDMKSVVFVDLLQARRDLNAIRAAGLYLDSR
jgi:hypothetical protein